MRWNRTLSKTAVLGFIAAASSGAVFLAFRLSEHQTHHENGFIRRFPHHPTGQQYEADLGFSSYYFAGFDGGSVFLGNYTAPLHILELDTTLAMKKSHRIELSKTDYRFKATTVSIRPPFFYVADGTVPVVFKGQLSNWKAELQWHGNTVFNSHALIGTDSLAIRGSSGPRGENILGVLDLRTNSPRFSPRLLEKQIDGVFDTDGTLLYSNDLSKIIYTYYYRNQFIVAGDDLNLSYRGKTIDTTEKARLKIAYIKNRNEYKVEGPPPVVNAATATHGKYLFINSRLRGKYEPKQMWEQATVIDVYDLTDKTYQFSFYFYDTYGKRMNSFRVTDTHLFALADQYLVVCRLEAIIRKGMRMK